MNKNRNRATINKETTIDSGRHTSGFGVIKNGDVVDSFNSGFGILKSAKKQALTQLEEIQHNIPSNKIVKPRIVHSKLNVKSVKNKEVQPTDQSIFDSIERVFDLMRIFPKNTLQVDVKEGWVTLAGTVDWQFQHDATMAAINHLTGVRGLVDRIHVLPDLNALEKITN
ncbi:BON domain-containing protein [Sapientia aquatica]|uniref:BON domain-containing protein n=1 Tax=Sapientia aquatica TaxID=1549640 RepID=A0A4R5W3Z4_9BURK|nr:BON domain-containing protein [Sapientia aquatica]TDK67065.1 BON domain-containing protein [Sapientia aquatica]